MVDVFDVIVVGGGPAGLSASLILARCLRKIIVFDQGLPRNMHSQWSHGYLSRDGINPMELLRISREQLSAYDVELVPKEIIDASKEDELFKVTDENGRIYYSKKLLIATGLKDVLPPINGIEGLYGKSVFHCPYCDGYEIRGKALAAYGYHKSGTGLSIALTTWSSDIILFTEGRLLSDREKKKLHLNNIKVITDPIKRLEGTEKLERIVLSSGASLQRDALFFTTDQYQRSHLAEQLGCDFAEKNVVKTDNFQQTNVPGLYVAGDASKDVQLLIIAAAEGAKAGVVINKSLQKEKQKSKAIKYFR